MSTHQPVEVRSPRALEGLSRLALGACFSVMRPSVAVRIASGLRILASSLLQGSPRGVSVMGV